MSSTDPRTYQEAIYEVLFKLRTTREIEHNDYQSSTEFVYTLEEAKQAILHWVADEVVGDAVRLNHKVEDPSFESRRALEDALNKQKQMMLNKLAQHGYKGPTDIKNITIDKPNN